MHVAGAELPEIAPDPPGACVGRRVSGLGGIVLADVDHVLADLAAMDGEDPVLHHVGVVVHGIVSNLAGDLQQLRGDFHAPEAGYLKIGAGVRLLRARDGQRQDTKEHGTEAPRTVTHHFASPSA